jgi:hypothetical protein
MPTNDRSFSSPVNGYSFFYPPVADYSFSVASATFNVIFELRYPHFWHAAWGSLACPHLGQTV